MLGNYTSGGQILLHKIRMFRQVASTTLMISFLLGSLTSAYLYLPKLQRQDIPAAITYLKAKGHQEMYEIFGSANSPYPVMDAFDKKGLYKKDIQVRRVLKSAKFKTPYEQVVSILYSAIFLCTSSSFVYLMLVFVLWAKFGKRVTSDQQGQNSLLSAQEVKKRLKALRKASDIKIGDMPLVKDSETRHILVTGSTGSGKTNLIHNILQQIEKRDQPALVIDQTGEMIASYYNPDRGDIIFNPLDQRGKNWDFWSDCLSSSSSKDNVPDKLKKFSHILFSGLKGHNDPFWDSSAERVFNEIVCYLARAGRCSFEELYHYTNVATTKELQEALKGSVASRYLSNDSKGVASSILSILSTSSHPMSYLKEGSSFSLNQHFKNISQGSKAWLFLATAPHMRSLTLPLISALTELSISILMEQGIDKDRRLWVVIDELASLGKLPALSGMMSEGRKYGASVVSAMQSINQLYKNYGQYEGSTLFGQFATKFFFRNDEPAIANMISQMAGSSTIVRNQKNTSFGANEFRDGVSYSEQEIKKRIVEYEDIASLNVGECYAILPEPTVRLSKVQMPEVKVQPKNEGFVAGDSSIIQNRQLNRAN